MKCIIIANKYKKEAHAIAKQIDFFLKQKQIQSDIYVFDGKTKDVFSQSYSFVITLGGDGTVLYAARYCAAKDIPIFPINLGEFGFIAGIQPSDWENPLLEFINSSISINKRMMLFAQVYRNDKCIFTSPALNDIVISSEGIAKIVNLKVHFNNISFGTYKADGIIVASPTGSTAYSAASGGPIVSPDLAAFIVTPICSFSLSNRPIVLPPQGALEVSVLDSRHNNAVLTIDGQETFTLFVDDIIIFSEFPHKASLVGCDSSVFYSALQSKLNWSGIPVAIKREDDKELE